MSYAEKVTIKDVLITIIQLLRKIAGIPIYVNALGQTRSYIESGTLTTVSTVTNITTLNGYGAGIYWAEYYAQKTRSQNYIKNLVS